MGLYNTVKIDLACPNCGALVEWQSKHLEIRGYPLDCLLLEITLEPDMDGEMHTNCDACKAYVEVAIVRGLPREPVVEKLEQPAKRAKAGSARARDGDGTTSS